MKILFISDNFPPEVNAPASRTYEHCREWVRLGHSVTVITCFPNFPHGKIYKGYSNEYAKLEKIDGIEVIRVWSYITANSGFVKRILDYMSFMLLSILLSFRLNKYDVVVGTSPQFFTAVSAHIIGKIKGIPFVFELRDIWPESIRAVGAMQESVILNIFEWIELYLYRKANKIVAVTHAFKANLVGRGIRSYKISVVRNGVDLDRFRAQPKDKRLEERLNLKGTFNVGYIGTHGLAHALETIVDAANIFEKELGDQYNNIQFILIGSGANKNSVKKYSDELRLKNIIFINSVPKEEVVRYWSILDLAVVHLKNTPLFKSVIPSKIFESMGMGIPILHGVNGESAEIVKDTQTGMVFQPENATELVKAICYLHDHPIILSDYKRNCIIAAEKFNRVHLAADMISILKYS